ncbi:aminoglycoside N(3)-acetyltransferase [Streptomyces sp. NPDC047928]|uniref:aminoglycoside N(3)-acetyltransferase n=1 Tax=unclassified Streptomyces TaxID=2593676 RepID=UPI003722E764
MNQQPPPPPGGHTEHRLAAQLTALGVEPGGFLLVHASLRALGPVAGGGRTVVRALLRALGPDGTLVVPTFTAHNSDTSPAYRERVRGLGDAEVAAVRASMEPYDPLTMASTGVGILPELVRTAPGALRSAHPQTSFAALGAHAEKVVGDHRPDCHLGEDSPLARLYDLRARILLLGTGFDTCTAFHLGEYRVRRPPRRAYRCVVREGGVRRWWEYEDVDLTDGDFGALGGDLEREAAPGRVVTGPVGSARARLLGVVDAVDHARDWLERNRPRRPGPHAGAARPAWGSLAVAVGVGTVGGGTVGVGAAGVGAAGVGAAGVGAAGVGSAGVGAAGVGAVGVGAVGVGAAATAVGVAAGVAPPG